MQPIARWKADIKREAIVGLPAAIAAPIVALSLTAADRDSEAVVFLLAGAAGAVVLRTGANLWVLRKVGLATADKRLTPIPPDAQQLNGRESARRAVLHLLFDLALAALLVVAFGSLGAGLVAGSVLAAPGTLWLLGRWEESTVWLSTTRSNGGP